MDFLRRLFGERNEPRLAGSAPIVFEESESSTSGDERAIERYRYLLRTAPPETIEEAHAEAFAELTPEQRRIVLERLSQELPEHERTAGVRYDEEPRSLARLATRAEMRQPGTLERSFGGMGGRGVGIGGSMAGSFLSGFAGILVGSAIAEQFFGDEGYEQGSEQGDDAPDADADADVGESGDVGSDFGGGDFGDFGDF
jgi:hypothetical protein